MSTLDQIVSKLTREQCLQILNDPGIQIDKLQAAMAVVAVDKNGTPAAPAVAGGFGVKPATAPAAAPAAGAKKRGRPAKGAAPANGAKVPPMDAIKAFVAQGLGFGKAELAIVCGLEARDGSLSSAVKAAMVAGIIHAAGEKRFMRYGGTPQVAEAAVAKAKAEASGPATA